MRQGRGGQGVIGIKLTGRKGKVVAAFMVGLDDDIVATVDVPVVGDEVDVRVRFTATTFDQTVISD